MLLCCMHKRCTKKRLLGCQNYSTSPQSFARLPKSQFGPGGAWLMKHLRHLQGCANCLYAEPLITTPKHPSQATVLWLDLAPMLPPFLGGPASTGGSLLIPSRSREANDIRCLQSFACKIGQQRPVLKWQIEQWSDYNPHQLKVHILSPWPANQEVPIFEEQKPSNWQTLSCISGHLLHFADPAASPIFSARSIRCIWRCPVLWRHANHFSSWLLPHSASEVMVQLKSKKVG